MKTAFVLCIDGAEWSVEFRPQSRMPKNKATGKPDWGNCNWEKRRILINESLSDEQQGFTLIHEITHAHNPHYKEEAVLEFENIASDAFVKAGFKITRASE